MIYNVECWEKLKIAARKGDSDAEWEVGLRYADGLSDSQGNIIVKPNPEKAVNWYRKASEKENPSAQLNLGYCYDIGFGVPKNKSKALFWYKKAFSNGNVSAAINIATIYQDKKNNKRAFFWYSKAAELNDGDALFEIGYRYLKGLGVRRKYNKAVKYLEQAIHSDNITEESREKAFYWLGMIYYDGLGVKKTLSLALKWFEMANQDNDNADAIQMIEKIKKDGS
jgi:TPR repeat protein